MELPKNPYHVIKNYLDKDYCKTMASYFIENMEEDPRESYGTFGLGGRTYFFDEPIEDLGSKTHVMGLFLTDDYEGGELYFQDYDVSLKPEIGDLVFFPGYYTRHGVRQVTSGVRINILSHYFDISDRSKINPSYTVHKK